MARNKDIGAVPKFVRKQVIVTRTLEAILLLTCFMEYFMYLYAYIITMNRDIIFTFLMSVSFMLVTVLFLVIALGMFFIYSNFHRNNFIKSRQQIEDEMGSIEGIIMTKLLETQKPIIAPLLQEMRTAVARIDNDE
jgi:uncharacterized membrane protein YqhA